MNQHRRKDTNHGPVKVVTVAPNNRTLHHSSCYTFYMLIILEI